MRTDSTEYGEITRQVKASIIAQTHTPGEPAHDALAAVLIAIGRLAPVDPQFAAQAQDAAIRATF